MKVPLGTFLLFSLAACFPPEPGPTLFRPTPVPGFFPNVSFPEDNLPNQPRIELGRALFHDKRLSKDNSVSCATCHKPGMAMADNQPITPGIEGRLGLRNAPSIINVAWGENFMMDGGVPTLELQALEPIHNPDEMGEEINNLVKKLSSDERLKTMAQAAYGRPMDSYVIMRALACFQRTLVSKGSRYDRFAYENEPESLSAQEKMGMELFFSEKTQCSVCHSGPFFTDRQFHNIGLYKRYADTGRERITMQPSDSGKFRTPSLRNVALTPPYMHNGSLRTLAEVIDHFDSGGQAHALKSEHIRALHLTDAEKAALEAFLNALSDDELPN